MWYGEREASRKGAWIIETITSTFSANASIDEAEDSCKCKHPHFSYSSLLSFLPLSLGLGHTRTTFFKILLFNIDSIIKENGLAGAMWGGEKFRYTPTAEVLKYDTQKFLEQI